ncbi:Uncharacterised protein [Candidatus Tiddalikarchaeum anstoanum]|nr:Uncharacterised protein [Candidatus Tiddalikarchaeum anstoanum]
MKKQILLLLVILVCACTRTNQNNELTNKGLTLTPKSFSEEDFTLFWEKAKLGGTFISWTGKWDENTARTVTQLAKNNRLTSIIEIQVFNTLNGELTINESSIEEIVRFAENSNAEFIGLGVEVNNLYEKSKTNYDSFIQVFNNLYDRIKTASPNTKVFTIFQLEKMKGLNEGLFGGADNELGEWFLLDNFSKADFIGFTTYPCLIYKEPSDIPADYYSEIMNHTLKQVSFTEIGWFSTGLIGWESSEEEQSNFITEFFNQTRNLNAAFNIWSFLYDQNVPPPFNNMGLYYANGSEKLGWNAWI